MNSIHEVKRPEVCETPLLLFECRLASGVIERWSTHGVSLNGDNYEARVLKHNLLEMRSGTEGGVDACSRLTLTLANADSYFSQIARNVGWKGAKLSVRFVFFNLKNRQAASELSVVFRGIANPPDEISEAEIRLTFASRMNLQRILLPQVRIQRRCPWMFPTTEEQRTQAKDGGAGGAYSPFYRCGYSAGIQGGVGSLNAGEPFHSCDYTRLSCEQRGMFDKDASNVETRRFGGIEFVPSTIQVKSYGEKGTHTSAGIDNEAKYNDFVPMIYGTAWYRPPVVFARNDGNLTRMEVLLGVGEISDVLKVVVNGNELPPGTTRSEHITSTGWFNIVSRGERNGGFNPDFKDGSGNPMGDPYGSMAVLSVVVPNRISDGTPLPKIDVLIEGLKLPVFDESSGTSPGMVFTNNPAWVLLDLLRRSGWDLSEIDVRTFAKTAAYCGESIETDDLHGNRQSIPRFQCNLVIRQRRSAADVIRGVRNGAGLYLTYGLDGLLELHPESSFAIQHPDKPECSNSTESLGGGWPVYEFGDGSNGFSDIARRSNGQPAVKVWSRSTAESPNRYSIEFQDEFNEYQQDSLSLVDLEDALQSGEEVAASLLALGIPNFNQAGRILRLHLDKSLRANTYIDLETGVRGVGLKPGDLITVTYAKEGFQRQPFRIVRIAPGLNYSTVAITAQIHEDSWYTGDSGTGLTGGGRQPGSDSGVPRPLCGTVVDANEDTSFAVAESAVEGTDGSYDVDIAASFAMPTVLTVGSPAVPLVSLAASVASTGGTLRGGTTYWYGVTAVQDGAESRMSFLVRATVPAGSDTNSVMLEKLSFAPGSTGFYVYRGKNPLQLLRIASEESVAVAFTDTGLEVQPITPPDPNFDHANFYWRLELRPEQTANIHSASTIGNDDGGMNPNEYRGKVVRISQGKGRGQERAIASNDETTLTIMKPWEVEPDGTSVFVVAEPAWTFGSQSQTSPAVFRIPNRIGAVIHISGRAANVHDRECAPEVSPLTRHAIGGAAGDLNVPPIPMFALRALGQGLLEVSGVGFETFENTRTISGADLTVHYVDELSTDTPVVLTTDVDAESTTIPLESALAAAKTGSLLQLDDEIVVVQSVANEGRTLTVDRGQCNSQASGHASATRAWLLNRKTVVLPFVKGFFGSPASGSYVHVLTWPDIRVVAGEMRVTNVRGISPTGWMNYGSTFDHGLRTLSGGQIVLQVDGPAAVQSNAVPYLPMDSSHAIRDVSAMVTEAPVGSALELNVTVDGEPWCPLTIADGEAVSNVVDGAALGCLRAEQRIGLHIAGVGRTLPGSGLSVSIRF